MSLATATCARCGAALAADAGPEVTGRARCATCADRGERRRNLVMTAILVCAGVATIVSAWQMLVA